MSNELTQNLIIYEDNHLIAVNKTAGQLVQGDKTGDQPLSETLKAFLKKKYDKPGNVFVGVIHRLDRPVSGVVLFAKTSKALSRMNAQFREKTIRKTYLAVSRHQPQEPSGKLVHFLLKNQSQNKSYSVPPKRKGALRAELSYKLLRSIDNFHLIEVNPKTGRHHQIRVQLSTMGCVIKGDLKYGDKRSNADGGIHLHARALNFTHPVSKMEIRIEAEVPDDRIWKALVSG